MRCLLGERHLAPPAEPEQVQDGERQLVHVKEHIVAGHASAALRQLEVPSSSSTRVSDEVIAAAALRRLEALARATHGAHVEVAVVLRRRAADDDAPAAIEPLQRLVEERAAHLISG